MISAPLINVQCDQTLAETGERCRRAGSLMLPCFAASREQAGGLFIAVNPDWYIAPGTLAVFCPQCRRIDEARMKGATR